MELDLGQVRNTFIAESQDLLREMESALLELESDPADQNALNALFRAAHTIKGSSGVLGIGTVERFTHLAENLLDKMRAGEIKASPGNVELLLQCRDHIATLIDRASGDTEELPAEVLRQDSELSERLNACLGAGDSGHQAAAQEQVSEAGHGPSSNTDAWHISIRFGKDVLRGGMDPISFISYLAKMGEITSITTLLCSMPAPAEMEHESCYLGFEIDIKSDFDKQSLYDVFEFVREDSFIHILPPCSRIASYIELINNQPENTLLLGEILVKGGALTREELDSALKMQNERPGSTDRPRIGEILVNEGSTYHEIIDAALEKQKRNKVVSAREAATIRIDAAKLDSLMNLVGELVIAGASIDQHAQRIADTSMQESASMMLRLVEEIRGSAMKVRMVPIGDTFSRFRRVVRDISRDLGKEIELVISGADTELDKNVIEKISDPLMHLVRNAADHGIETPQERGERGKKPSGTICLNACHDAGSIVIEVIDDGKGFDREKIAAKASLGLITPGQQLTDSEVYKLIFEPGFSTAAEVTKFSGRGVGMDVVRKNIEALRGTIDMESSLDAGTTVRIRLPLTMAIIDGFMVGIGDSPYIIPLDMVVECMELSEEDRKAAGKRNYINLRGEVLPFVRLREFFNQSGDSAKYENIVIVQYSGHKIGLVVDELFGEVQTVIKSLGRAYREVKGISGATILGNGRVALILDVPRLIQSIEALRLSA